MDIALMLYRINPEIWTRPSNPPTLEDILEWGGAASLPTQQAIDTEWAAYLVEVAASDAVTAVEAGAEAQAQAIPGWVNWNEAAWLAWHLTNMETPLSLLPADIDLMTTTAFNANAKAMMGVMQDVLNAQSLALKNIGRLDIAQRNKLWPNLEDNGN